MRLPNAIGTERVEDVVIDKDLGVPRLSGVQRSNLTPGNQDCTASGGLVVIGEQLGGQAFPEHAILNGLAG